MNQEIKATNARKVKDGIKVTYENGKVKYFDLCYFNREDSEFEADEMADAEAEAEADALIREHEDALRGCCCGISTDPGCSVHGWE